MKEKEIIITPKQLSEIFRRTKNTINEENTVTITAKAKDDSLSSFATAATAPNTLSDIQKARGVGDVALKVGGPNASDDQPTQEIEVGAGDTVQNAITTQGNSALVQGGGTIKITGDGFGESKTYTKQTIEEARLSNMRKNGCVFTKKELNENFMFENEIEDKIETLNVSTVLKAFEAVGGIPQELESEWDITPVVMKKYNEATPEQQEAFMSILNGEN